MKDQDIKNVKIHLKVESLQKLIGDSFEDAWKSVLKSDSHIDLTPLIELTAITLYLVEGPFYKMVNHVLRWEGNQQLPCYEVTKEAVEAWRPYKELLISSLENINNEFEDADAGEEWPVYRGLNIRAQQLYPGLQVGSEFSHGEFLSTSEWAKDPITFCKTKGTFITIENAVGYKVPEDLQMEKEEVILLPGARFKVKSIRLNCTKEYFDHYVNVGPGLARAPTTREYEELVANYGAELENRQRFDHITLEMIFDEPELVKSHSSHHYSCHSPRDLLVED